jgi:hypothetical protein
MRAISIAFTLVLLGSGVSVLAQSTAGSNPAVRPDKNAPKAVLQPLHVIKRKAGFKVVELPASKYSFMSSEIATLPKGFLGALKAPQNIVMLCYGSKKGGIVRMYQSKAVAGLDPRKFMQKVADLGIFRDVNRRPGWRFEAKVSAGRFIFPTSSSLPTVQDAVSALKL